MVKIPKGEIDRQSKTSSQTYLQQSPIYSTFDSQIGEINKRLAQIHPTATASTDSNSSTRDGPTPPPHYGKPIPSHFSSRSFARESTTPPPHYGKALPQLFSKKEYNKEASAAPEHPEGTLRQSGPWLIPMLAAFVLIAGLFMTSGGGITALAGMDWNSSAEMNATAINNAPLAALTYSNWTLMEGKSATIDLAPYFTDADSDTLTYVATESSHINVTVEGASLTLKSGVNWTGIEEIVVIASDGKEMTRTNISVSVVREMSETETLVANAPFEVDDEVAHEIDADGETIVLVELDMRPRKPAARETDSEALDARTKKDEIASARESLLKGNGIDNKDGELAALDAGTAAETGTLELAEGYDNLPLAAVRIDKRGLSLLIKKGGVKAVHANRLMKISLAESLPLVKADLAWNITINVTGNNGTIKISGEGQSVCVLDTGLDLTHQAFLNRTIPGYDFVNSDDNPSDDNGHGTHVSGIAASMAPGATIAPVKVCGQDGSCFAATVLSGIDYCINLSQNGVNVSAISASIGDGLAYGPDTCPNDIDFALSAARDAEIVNIYASGNEGATNGVTYPACSPYSLSVGAVDKNGAIAGFTDRGPGLDVLAPGMNVNSTLPGGNGARSGTSMAAPFVSGTVAMMRQYTQSNGLTGLPSTIENAITKSGANNTGWPLLDTHAAILLLQPQSNQTQNTTSNQTTPNQTYQILAAPTLTYVNITPFTPNSTTAVAGVWNYTDGDGDLQNGSTYTWFVNNTEAWRDSSLVGYWKLDGDGLDALNINNGNLTNSPLTTPGLIKSALNFSGVSSYIDLHTSAFGFTKTTPFSGSAWVKTNVSSFHSIISNWRIVTSPGWNFFMGDFTTGKIGFGLNDADGSNYEGQEGASVISDGRWHHVAFTYNGSNTPAGIKLYVDGLSQTLTERSGGTKEPGTLVDGSLEIGRRRYATSPALFNGSIDEVKIFNRTLSATEIANEYQMMSYGSTEKDNSGTPSPDVPAALWHFDDNSTTQAYDYFGGNNGTIFGAYAIEGMFGTRGLFFNRTDSINTSNIIKKDGSPFTIQVWFKVPAAGGTANYDTLYSTGPCDGSFGLHTYQEAVRRLYVDEQCVVIVVAGSTIYSLDVWHQAALIYNGSHAKLFLDGVNDSGWVVAAQAGVEGIDTIGGIGSSYGMNGSIDEVEVYNRALTADEINQSYRRDFPLFGLNSSRFGANSSLTLQVEPIQSDGTAGPAVNSTPQGSIFLTIVNVTPNGTLFSYGSVVNLTANVTTSASALTVSANVTLPNGSIRVVPMTNSSSTTFRGNLSPMSLGGLYNFTVLANDSNSLLTNITSNFSINLPPSVSRVNITPFTPNNTTAVAGVWNYSDADGDAQNGTTYTWFVNGTEGWRDAGLVSYWKMDSEFGFNDTLGRNNASQNTASARPASTTGITKEAMIFDGSDDYVSTTSPVSNYPLTMSTWIKRIAGCDVLALSDSTVFTDYLSIWAGGTYFIVARSPSVNDQYDTGVAVSSGWNHIAGVFDSATDRKMYVNGVLIASRTSSVNPSYNTLGMGIVPRSVGSPCEIFNGSIDEVKIYNRSLTAAELANEYQMMSYGSTEKDASGTPAPDVPVALYHFNDNISNTRAEDFFGGNNATLSNATFATGVFGTNGVSFNGINTTVIGTNAQSLNLSGNLTLILWTNSLDGNDTNAYLVSKYGTGVLPSFGISRNLSHVICTIANSTSNQSARASVSLGSWQHVACTYNNTELAIYLNGAKANSSPFAGAINITTGPLYMGSLNGTSNFYNGSLDELEIYNRPFTADEINQSSRRDFPLFGLNSSKFGSRSSLTFQVEPIQSDGTAGAAVNSSTVDTGLMQHGQAPFATNFGDGSTNFDSVSDFNNVTNLSLVSGGGRIQFINNTNVSGADLDTFVKIANRTVSVNTTALPGINASALISIPNASCPNTRPFFKPGAPLFLLDIVQNGSLCADSTDPSCTNVVCAANTLNFTASHFTGFGAGANDNLTIFDDNDTIRGFRRMTNDSTFFFANFTNTTGTNISGPPSAFCEIFVNFLGFPPSGVNMSFNSTSKIYEFNTTPNQAGVFFWNVTCESPSQGFARITANDTINITPAQGAEFCDRGDFTSTCTINHSFMINRTWQNFTLVNLIIGDNASLNLSSSVNNVSRVTNLSILATGNITILGNLSANGAGFQDNEGPGSGTYSYDSGAGGGGYGGIGGTDAGAGGGRYGNALAPADLGSSGGSSAFGSGGRGGGHIQIDALGTLAVYGNVTSNGLDGPGHSGGGSGGSIILNATNVTGTGSVIAKGGSNDGSGGGGRIAIFSNDTNNINLYFNVSAGPGLGNGTTGTVAIINPLSNTLVLNTNFNIESNQTYSQFNNMILNNGSRTYWINHNLSFAVKNITIHTTAFLEGDSFGEAAQSGPGAGVYSDTSGAGGGGHGGAGGTAGTAGGSRYDNSLTPTLAGSGGGSSGYGPGGRGGVNIFMTATNTMLIFGNITSNGARGGAKTGGGAGGSILLNSTNVSGSGFIFARGASAVDEGAGGGGGRIAIYSNDTDSMNFSYNVSGGSGGGNGTDGTAAIIDVLHNNLIIPSNFRIESSHNYAQFGAILFNNGSLTIWSDQNVTVSSANITIHTTAWIRGDKTGGQSDQGPGKGGSVGTGSGGGGYGGAGGAGQSTGGSAYGSKMLPVDIGSGGGASGFAQGGAGGVDVALSATDNILAYGNITSNGVMPGAHTGGGSGGSILLNATTINITGVLQATGGNGNLLGGGGGGGRIGIISDAWAWSGSLNLSGGLGTGNGGNGTFNNASRIIQPTQPFTLSLILNSSVDANNSALMAGVIGKYPQNITIYNSTTGPIITFETVPNTTKLNLANLTINMTTGKIVVSTRNTSLQNFTLFLNNTNNGYGIRICQNAVTIEQTTTNCQGGVNAFNFPSGVTLSNGRRVNVSISGGSYKIDGLNGTGITTILNSSLVIFDDTDPVRGIVKNPNDTVIFFANYTDLAGENISGTAYCEIFVNTTTFPSSGVNMSFNSTSRLYEFNTSVDKSGQFFWNATCDGTSYGFDRPTANDTVNISPSNATAPVILFTSPTPPNNSFINVSTSFVNVSVNKNVTNCTLNFSSTLYNMSFINLDASTSSNYTLLNLSSGNYTYYVQCYDTFSNLNRTDSRTLTVDTAYPIFSDYGDNNATLAGVGDGIFNVTVTNSNGSVILEINNTNITATPVNTNFSGGTVTINGVYTIHTFTSNGTFNVTSATNVEVLVVAGGGGAGGGGGGAGGLLYNSSYPVSTGSMNITVGSGGTGVLISPGQGNGANGKNSSFGSLIAVGGGGGGGYNGQSGSSGGSGGGSGQTSGAGGRTGGSGTAGQGNSGGTDGGFTSAPYPGGGGGGSGGTGGSATSNSAPGVGGLGNASSINGTLLNYSRGGAGQTYDSAAAGVNGSSNTGNGGVAAGNSQVGGAGGSGIVIIKYLTPTSIIYNASYAFTNNGTYAYRWHSWGNGATNLYNLSPTRSYMVNVPAPVILFTHPTQANNSVIPVNFSFVNVSVNRNVTNCTLNFSSTLYNMSFINLDASTSANATAADLVGATLYTYYARCYDTLGNTNTTEVRTLTYNASYVKIINISPNGTTFAINNLVNISANVTSYNLTDTVTVNITLPDASLVTLSMANATALYRANFTLSNQTGTYLLAITANDSSGLKVTVNTSFNVIIQSANLTIFDDTDVILGSQVKYRSDVVHFFANYTNSTGINITGSNVFCTLNLNRTGFPNAGVNMSFNSTSKAYEFNTTFGLGGVYYWNVSCDGSMAGFNASFANDTVSISSYTSITNASPNGTTHAPSDVINISANVTSDGIIDLVFVNLTLANSSVIRLSMTNITTMYLTNFTLPPLTGAYLLAFTANDTTGLTTTLNTSFNVNYRNSNLTIFDDTDVILGSQVKYPGNNAHFFANYTNTSGTNISGGTCTLNLNKTGFPNSGVSMPFNASSKLYEFNTTFTSGGIYEWNVSCNGSLSGFTTVFANDTTNISVGGVVVVNMSPNGTSFTQETQARIAVNATSTAGVDEAWVNITLPDSTLVKLNLYNSSSQPDIWNATFTNTAQVGQYNMSFFANDTAGINGTERATFNITDSRNPNVTNVNAAPGIMNLTSSVNITADIQDETLIDKAIAQVTRSNGSAFNLTMSNLAGFVYNATYQTVQGEPLGRWNVTIIANDTRGNVNASMNTSFTVNDPTPPIITFIRQRPADIDAFNIFGNPLNITYNISDETQVNIASIILYHKTNSSTDDITYYVNGTAYGGFFNRSGTNSTIDQFATNWTAQLFDANVYPATYNYPERTLELTPHDQYELVSTTQFIKDRFFNVSNTKQFSFLELMSYNRSGTSGPLAIYYCNSSYTTGDPTTSNACTNFFNIAPTSTYNHSHSAFSSHHIIPFTFNTTTGNIGNVHVTALSYFLFKGQAGAAGWNVSNIPNISREDTTQYTTDNGATWSNINITIDAHLHQYDGSQTFWYYACANDTQGNSNCSQLRSDLINLSGLPPTAPDVYRPTEGSYRKNQTINYTAAQSPNSYPITGYNITLETQAGSFVRTIINNNSPNLSYVWNTSDATDGNYHIRVQACDNLSQCSSGYSANFTIDNSLPNVTALNISPAIINKAESVNITVNATDNISIGTTLAEITWPNGTVLNHTMSFLSGLTYNYTKRHAITDPEGRYTVRIIANDTAGNLNDSIVGYYNISNITINRTIYDNSSLSNSTIEDSDINNTVIAASYVRNSSIVNTSVQHSSVQNSTIERSTINETQINRSDIQDSTTLNATITWSTVTDSTISNSTVNTSAVSASNITNSRIENTSVQNSTMIRTTFEKGTVVSSNITNSTVSDSTIENSTVYGSTLTNVTLHGTLTVNCTMLNATVSGSLLDNLTVENSTVFDTNASRSYINDSYVNGSTINQTWMAGNLIDNCTIWNTTIINSTAVDCNISDSYVIDSDVNSSSVWNSSVIRSILTDGSFISNSTINRSIGRRVIVINGTARGSNITRCNFTGSIIEDSEAIDTTASAGAGGGTRITQGSSISNATMIASNATNVTVVNGTVQDEDLTDIIIINNEQDANCSCQLKRNSTIRGQVIFTGNSGPTMGKSGISLRCDEDGLGNSITGGGTGTGLTTSGKDNILIQGCTITNFTTGILIENSSNTRVINTQTLNNTIGARIENSTGVIISRLNSTGNNHPARFVNTPNMTAQNTTIGAGLTIENQTAGNINFTSEVNFTSSQNMLAYLTISNNSAIANSSISPGTNTSAIVTFINVNLSDPRVQTGDDGGANFRDCPPEQCQFISKNTSNQSFIFNVTHFSSYRLEDNIVRSNITNTSANNSLIDTSEVDNSTIRDSYVNHSNVNRSLLLNDTVVNSTITQSIIVNSSIVNTTIDNSTVNASYVNQSDIDSSQLIGSNVTASTIYNSNVTNSTINTSTITSSNITNSQAQNSTILNTTITKGIISDSTINSSVILNSSMTDSTLFNITASNSAINTTSASRCTITNSSIQNSTMDNCTISNSNTDDSFVNHTTLLNGSATDSRIVGSNIQNSTVNTSDIRESDINRTRAENTTITNSTITDSTITRGQIQNTSIDNSTFTSSNINRSSIDNTAVTASNITQSTINASDLNTVRAAFSNITNSTITNSLIENSTVYGSVLINVTLNGTYALNCTILNASTTGGTLVNNTITNSTTIESNISASIINNSRINASTVNTSAIDSATVISSAVLNSSITSSTITNSTIANSTINTSSVTESDLNRTRAENTTITNSTITDSTITRGQISNSTLDNSSVTGSRINKSSIDNTAINSSNITQSTINASDLNTVRAAFSNITNSTITNSLIENSTVYGSVLINVTLNGTYALNCTILNASTTGGTLVNNTITNSTTIESNISASIINNSRINASKINLTTSQTCTIIDSDVWNTSASSCLLEWSNVSASTFNTGRAWTSIIDNSSIEDGITLNSTINRSTLLHSNVTNSSRIVNTTVVNSTLSSFTLIDFGTVSNEPTAPAIYNLTVTPTIGNQTNAYNITATVLESTGVSVALANVTSPNGNKTTLTMSRQGASATYFAMFTTNITSEEGNHTVALDVNDTLNFRNASMTTSFVIQDITLPLVSNLSPVNGTQFTQDSLVMISANVTDNRGVDKVIATVSMPNSSVRTLTLENRTLYDIYNATFAEARIQGQYNVTISANDSSGNSNSTSATSFVVPFQGGQEVRTSVLLSQNISVNGSGLIIASDNVTLDCNGFAVIGNGTPIMINVTDKSNVTIKGCGLINATVCLLVRNATNSRTLGVTCDGATDAGAIVDPSFDTLIENSSFSNSPNGLIVFESNHTIVRNCNFTNNTIAINVTLSNFTEIRNNSFRNNTAGLWIFSGNMTLAYHNEFLESRQYAIVSNATGNAFNTSVAGIAQGNRYTGVSAIRIYDLNRDGYGDAGQDLPYNSTNRGNVSGHVQDFGPITSKINTPPNQTRTVPNMTLSVSYSASINLYEYFNDSEGDTITYITIGNITTNISINQTTQKLTVRSLTHLTGPDWFVIIANDSINATYSNNITATVISDPSPAGIGGGGGSGGGGGEQKPLNKSKQQAVAALDPAMQELLDAAMRQEEKKKAQAAKAIEEAAKEPAAQDRKPAEIETPAVTSEDSGIKRETQASTPAGPKPAKQRLLSQAAGQAHKTASITADIASKPWILLLITLTAVIAMIAWHAKPWAAGYTHPTAHSHSSRISPLEKRVIHTMSALVKWMIRLARKTASAVLHAPHTAGFMIFRIKITVFGTIKKTAGIISFAAKESYRLAAMPIRLTLATIDSALTAINLHIASIPKMKDRTWMETGLMAFIVKRKLNKTTGSIALAISNVKDKIKRPFRRHKTAGHHETPHFRWPTFRKTEEEIKPPRMPIVRRAAHEAMLRITLSLIMARNKMSDAMTMLKCRTAQIGHHQHTAHKKVRAHRTEKRKAKAAPKKKIGIGWIATDRELLRIKIRSIADRIKYGRFM